MSDLTPEEAAEALLEKEGFTVSPPTKTQASLWKPAGQEFFWDPDFLSLAAQVGRPPENVQFTGEDGVTQDGVIGHVLTATSI